MKTTSLIPILVLGAVLLPLVFSGSIAAGPLPGWEVSPPPEITGFDRDAIMKAARDLLKLDASKGIGLIPMNSRAPEETLSRILDGLRNFHVAGEPVVCVSFDARLVVDAIGRALSADPDAKFDGLDIVVAAPEPPIRAFFDWLSSQGVRLHYLKVVGVKR